MDRMINPKSEILNPKQILMFQIPNSKQSDVIIKRSDVIIKQKCLGNWDLGFLLSYED
ncbi:MAG: hypothetical protein HY769_01955 [Candidatus Stahlbacteria bacterium]|nr:hypothetical protein [Candidatus Stahlbacteria bacterium]